MLSHIRSLTLKSPCLYSPNRRTFSVENRKKERLREINSIAHINKMHMNCECYTWLEFESSITNGHLMPYFHNYVIFFRITNYYYTFFSDDRTLYENSEQISEKKSPIIWFEKENEISGAI